MWSVGVRAFGCLASFMAAAVLLSASHLSAAEYHVGPDQPIKRLEMAPFARLQAGDLLAIHWRPDPYRVKWVLACRGTKDKPIVIRGIPGPEGQLPVIEADGAITGTGLDYWSGQRGLIKIGGSNIPPDVIPAHIVIEGLEVRGARPGRNFFGRDGLQEYSDAASAIYIEKGEHITIRSCRLHDCANGFFTAPESSEILVEGCHIEGNGLEGSGFQHNSYTEAAGIIYQFNRFGPLRDGCGGTNLKDRSAGTVVRYNIIEGGNRQLDFVESQEGDTIKTDPRYHQAFVYGNLLIEPNNAGNPQIVHFGGDSGPQEDFRQGPLWFYHNTVVSKRRTNTTLLRLSTQLQSAEVFNNIVYVEAEGSRLSILDETGTARLHHNWLKKGYKDCHGTLAGTVTDSSNITGDAPGFRDAAQHDFRLVESSPARHAGQPLPNALAEQPVKYELVPPFGFRKRPADDRPDLGAFELP
ncbi:hypothetical protein Pan44_17280 [Caulifigura coniformis]|uniref:Right handed beta helix domain-containing protein n=1 Tax=Caulifigura coniformis TaxID=2527983 RepID=A0A517SC64_9PLAN|nr:right-handed parallel beta-helix repeat-containing protein [Caulifigura coniformis]QDT53705.1 hypothetical protein Pan44_17280 [Caulifigura coniformis]